MSKRLAIDLDGVLANFTDAYAKLLTSETGIMFPKATLEWPPVWAWDRAAGVTPEQEANVWQGQILDPKTKFWQQLAPLPGAIPVIRRLNTLAKHGHDVYFLTHRMGVSAKHQTESWLYEHGMDYPTAVLVEQKLPVLLALQVDAFIDDKESTIQSVQDAPFRVYIQDAPYNRAYTHPKVTRVTGVQEMLEKEGLWT